MNRDQLLQLKTRDPDRYRQELAAIEERYGTAGPPAPVAPTGQRASGIDSFLAHMREAFGLNEGQTSQLGLIRRGAVYACATLRADMLSSLPVRAYKLGGGRGRQVDIRDPLRRMGMPLSVRGVRLSEVNTVTEVEGTDLARRLARPNEDWTGRSLMRMTEIGLCLAGQAHWRLHGRGPRADKAPQELSWLRHDRVQIARAGKGDSARTIKGWMLDPQSPEKEELQKGEILWMHFPDPEDPDYGALAPGDIARLGADSYHDAMQSNRDIFRRGLQAAGLIMPPEGIEFFDSVQMEELARDIDRKVAGKGARHRLPVLKYRFGVENLDSVSPREAEFVALLSFAIEDAARVYRIPIEFIGGTRRTYQNMQAAFTGIWMMALEPETCFIADELSFKLVPAFGEEADFLAFDLSNVTALQEDEKERWRRSKEQMEAGVLTANEWREGEGKDPLEIDVALNVGQVTALVTVVQSVGQGIISPEQGKAIVALGLAMGDAAAEKIIGSGPPEAAPEPEPVEDEDLPPPTAEEDPSRNRAAEPPVYDSDDHRRIMARVADDLDPLEEAVAGVVRDLLERQRDSLLDKLKDRRHHSRIALDDIQTLFGLPRWIREFRERIKPELERIAKAGGAALLAALDLEGVLDTSEPAVINFLRARAQRFATEVNDTTWSRLKSSLADGIDAGESIADLAVRVKDVMDGRLASSPETIARTEVLGAYSGGSLEAARQTGLTLEKTWLSALDSRVRDTHASAHGQTVALSENFDVGGAKGPGPGLMGDAGEDINCRCTVIYGEADNNERGAGRALEVLHAVHAALTV